ncbi:MULTISPECIES: hypothetical protein [Microcoleaceae]|uniref:hypothetical protein n=1 Tax=Microcoleaceae TaxID=1892252 RepID=UPI00187EB8D0|nr:hypothetical protein [Tychonema sp. LEGE 06208]
MNYKNRASRAIALNVKNRDDRSDRITKKPDLVSGFESQVDPQRLTCRSGAMFGNIRLNLIFDQNVVELGVKDSGANP